MKITKQLEIAIMSNDIEVKERITEECLLAVKEDIFESEEHFTAKVFEAPCYASVCEIVLPQHLKVRKDFDTKEGLASLVHSIAHIEFSAIDLALDAVYRYVQMPLKYKQDWLEVASDEIRHFKMLNNLLEDLAFKYGDFPVHCGLFDASHNTRNSLLDRMAIVPRYFEASGLDVSPIIIKKLANKHKIPAVNQLIKMLELIQEEEIDHVLKGDKWFKYMCKQEGVEEGKEEEKYFEILEKYKLRDKHRPHINVKARKEAGFSCVEIKRLGGGECE